MTAPDGFKQACAGGYCFQNGEPITVWRNPSYTPVFDAAYRYSLSPMSATGKSIDVAYGSTNNGTPVQQWRSSNTDNQKFAIQPSGLELEDRDEGQHQQVLRPRRQRHRQQHRASRSRTATAAATRPGTSRPTRTPVPSS